MSFENGVSQETWTRQEISHDDDDQSSRPGGLFSSSSSQHATFFGEPMSTATPNRPNRVFAMCQDIENDSADDALFLYQLHLEEPTKELIKYVLPKNNISGALVSSGSCIYWVGGERQRSFPQEVYMIDMSSDHPTWRLTGIQLRHIRHSHTAAVHSDALYVMGGYIGGNDPMGVDGEKCRLSGKGWKSLHMLKTPEKFVSLFPCEEYTIIIQREGPNDESSRLILRIQEIGHTKEIIPPSFQLHHRHAAVAIGYDVYIIGGKSEQFYITRYNVEGDWWSREEYDSFKPRWNCSACNYKEYIIIAGGYTSPPGNPYEEVYMDDVHCYDPKRKAIRKIGHLATKGLYQNSMVAV